MVFEKKLLSRAITKRNLLLLRTLRPHKLPRNQSLIQRCERSSWRSEAYKCGNRIGLTVSGNRPYSGALPFSIRPPHNAPIQVSQRFDTGSARRERDVLGHPRERGRGRLRRLRRDWQEEGRATRSRDATAHRANISRFAVPRPRVRSESPNAVDSVTADRPEPIFRAGVSRETPRPLL